MSDFDKIPLEQVTWRDALEAVRKQKAQSELSATPCSPRRLELQKLKRWPKLARHLQGRKVRIWSGEWGSWWRPGGNGYTCDSSEAGIFVFEDALARSRHAGPEKQIEYVEAENCVYTKSP